MDMGKVCYSSLAQKDVCNTRRHNREKMVPETLKCHRCAPWLLHRIWLHTGLRTDEFKDMKMDLEKYLGKLSTSIVYASIKFSVNYTSEFYAAGLLFANSLGWNIKEFNNKPAHKTGEMIPGLELTIIPEVSNHSTT